MSVFVAVIVGTAVMGGLIYTLISAESDSLGPPAPTGPACEKLLKQQSPDLMAEANRILRDQTAVSAIADCRSGAYPSVEGVTADRATDIVRRMQQLGSAEPRSPDECLKYLKPADCGQTWVFQPAHSRRRYLVSLDPRAGADGRDVGDAGSEFGIELDR
jgi:hypothetical protein